MKVVFMGTPAFSVAALDALVAAGHEIAAVYTQPPRPAGRGKTEHPTPVATRATELGVEVRWPTSLKGRADEIAALNADVGVVVAYGLLLPQDVLDAPRLGCLNIHASLLPRWRGAAPIQRAIMAGDAETGVCIMQMEAGLDTGPVISRQAVPIGPDATAGTLHDQLMETGAAAIVDALAEPVWHPEAQSKTGVTYAAKIDKAEAEIDWTKDAVEIDRQIRGLSPFPGAWAQLAGTRVKFHLSEVVAGQGAPGHVLDDAFAIACGSGAVRILSAQRAGKGVQAADEFLRGFPLPKGTDLL